MWSYEWIRSMGKNTSVFASASWDSKMAASAPGRMKLLFWNVQFGLLMDCQSVQYTWMCLEIHIKCTYKRIWPGHKWDLIFMIFECVSIWTRSLRVNIRIASQTRPGCEKVASQGSAARRTKFEILENQILIKIYRSCDRLPAVIKHSKYSHHSIIKVHTTQVVFIYFYVILVILF